ncbi:MAG: amidase family protein, partial [Bacillota bacterium]
AQQARDLLRDEYTDVLASCDAVLTPVAPSVAFRLGEKTDDPMAMYMGDLYTVTANLTGLPAISVPCGHVLEHGDTLPVGMSLLGAKNSMQTLLTIAYVYENAMKPNAGIRPYELLKGGATA